MDMLDVARLIAAWSMKHDIIFNDLNDVGVPLARLMAAGAAMPTPRGAFYLNETWASLCAMLDIDPAGIYTSVDDMEGGNLE